MREHNFASISNTSIHEAYPGHHLQLDTARRNRSLTRLLTDAPEFVEGWGMYSELMMREHGFDDDPRFRLVMHTDAIWRACRIILDVRMHRGELSVEEATDFLVEHTQLRAAERPRRGPVVHLPPDLSRCRTCSGGRCCSACVPTSSAGSATGSASRRFHDTLLRNGSLPISFHRRLLTAGA